MGLIQPLLFYEGSFFDVIKHYAAGRINLITIKCIINVRTLE